MLWLALALALLGLLLLWLARRRQAVAGLPPGRVIYMDTDHLRRNEQALYDPATDLTGRPDYLVRQGSTPIPVEVKSGRAPLRPHPSHVLQLAAYCLLVEAVYGRRPAYGVLKYADRAFAIDYDRALEAEVRRLIAEMHAAGDEVQDRSHDSPARCRACGFHHLCDQRLA